MRTCPKCMEEIKDEATICKHCKSKVQKKRKQWHEMNTAEKISGIIVLIISALFFMWIFGVFDNSVIKENRRSDSISSICAQKEVSMKLKSPSTAKFSIMNEEILKNENQYRVLGYVDSENAFGAMIRTSYACDVEVTDTETFECNTSCELS